MKMVLIIAVLLLVAVSASAVVSVAEPIQQDPVEGHVTG